MSTHAYTHTCNGNCLHDDVMEQIMERHIKMRPKVYFVAGSALLGVGMAGAVITSVFFTHLLFYRARQDAVFSALGLGKPGMDSFISVFPWEPLIIATGGLIGGAYLLREYEISHKHRYARLIIAFCALVVTLGYLLDQAEPNRHIARMKPLYGLYQQQSHAPFMHGTVERIQGDRVVVRTPYDTEFIMDLQSSPKDNNIKIGSSVRAVGIWRGEVFYIQRVLVR